MSAGANYPTPKEYEEQGSKPYNPKNENPHPPPQTSSYNSKYGNPQSPPQTGSSRQVYVVVVEEEDEMEPAENEEEKFRTRSQRMLFVRKVLATVGLQFLICTSFMAASYMIEPARKFFIGTAGIILAFVCMAVWTALYCAIGCCKVGYGKPSFFNVSLLLLSTILLSVYSTSFVVHFDIPSIMIAAATTVGTVLILALLTFHTKIDISGKGMHIFGASIALMLFSFITTALLMTGVIPFTRTNAQIVSLVVGGLFAILLAIMILYQLKLIVGGGRYQYGENDWLIASISLFYDILLFFLNILGMFRVG